MSDRAVENILNDLERSARRLRPFLIIGLALIFLSLAGSIYYLNDLRRTAEAEAAKAQSELKKFKALQHVVTVAQNEPPEIGRQTLRQASELAAQSAAPQPPQQVPLTQLDLNIFICTGSPTVNRTNAEALRKMRLADATGRWQRNYLNEVTNSKALYRLTRNEIRYNPNEEEAARQLQLMIRDKLGVESALVLTFFPTPNSMSVFFCEGANPPPITTAEVDSVNSRL